MKRIIYTMLLFLLVIPITASASEAIDRDNSVDVEILPGKTYGNSPLHFVFDGNYEPDVFYDNDSLLYPDAIDKIKIVDLTGTWEGWTLSVEADTLKNDEHELPGGSLSLVEPNVNTTYNEDSEDRVVPEVSFEDKSIVDDGLIPVVDASKNSGMGETEISFEDGSFIVSLDENSGKELKGKARPESGYYHTTLKWTLASADGEIVVTETDKYSLYVDIDNIGYDEVVEQETSGISMPETATEIFNIIFVGIGLVAIGIIPIVNQKKKDK